MKNLILFLLAVSLWAAAPTATLTLTEMDSGTQTDRPFSISYVFAKGDIPNYPRPVIGGTPESIWQANVKTRWRDGTASCSISDASNTEPIYITCAAHGFLTGESVVIADVEGNTSANGRWKIYAFSYNQFALIGSSANGDYTTGGTATGPGPGSVKHAIISFTESFTADQSKTLTFRNSVNPCSSGDQSACDAAGLNEAEMLAFNSSNWDARIETTASSITHTFAGAREIVDAATVEYWLLGPVATVVIVRDNTSARAYDKGYNCLTNCTGNFSSATWSDDTTNKALHPTYQLWFYTGWNGVKVDYILENTWATFAQPQRYDWAVMSDTSFSTTEDSANGMTHYMGSRWRVTAWDGDEPGTVEIDRNRLYLQTTGVIPNYPEDKTITPGDLTTLYNTVAAGDYVVGSGDGLWNKYFPAVGGRPDLGLLPAWYVHFVMGGFPAATEPFILALGDISGYVAAGSGSYNNLVHLRESVKSGYFWDADADGSADGDADDNIAGNGAFGRPISIHTRPTSDYGAKGWSYLVAPGSSGWSADRDHQPSMVHLPYLLTGDPYYLEEMYFWGAWNVWGLNGGLTEDYHRHGSWGLLKGQVRAMWALRNQASAAYFAPDGSMEKEYFRTNVDRIVAAWEGFTDVRGPTYLKVTNAPDNDPCPASGGTNGSFSYNAYSKALYAPASSTPWCWGRNFLWRAGNRFHWPGYYPIPGGEAEAGMNACYTNSNWMLSIAYMSAGWTGDMGFPVDGWMRGGGEPAIVQSTHPDWNRKFPAAYRFPMYGTEEACSTSTSWVFQTPEAFYSAYGTYSYPEWTNNYAEGGYIHMWLAALSYLGDYSYGRYRGPDALAWYTNETNVPNARTWDIVGGTFDFDYTYALKPRTKPVRPTVEQGDTFAIFRYTVPAADSSCTVAGGADGLTGRSREFVKTGLTAETEYSAHAVSCSDDPWGSTTVDAYTTLATLSGTGSFAVTVGSGSTTVYVDWDYDGAAPWANTDSESCAAGCTVALTSPNKGLIYYRIRRDAGGDIVGAVRAAIVR